MMMCLGVFFFESKFFGTLWASRTSLSYPRLKGRRESLKKSSKRKGESYLQRSSHKTVSGLLKRNLPGKKGLERSVSSHERQGPTSKITVSSKAIIYNGRADKVLPR